MELRHLRYFLAVAETGSLTVAAERRLHTSQPSLSRQIRDLEDEVGVELFSRSARGVELTAAGKAFLDHARLALTQVDAAIEAARRAAQPTKQVFALGFLTGQEMTWLPRAMQVLRDELPNIDVTVSSHYSPDLGDHRLTRRAAIRPEDFVGEPFIMASNKARVAHAVIVQYLQQSGVNITPEHGVDNLAMAMSLVASTRGLALMPEYANNLMPWSVVSRPLEGDAPTIDLVIGYSKSNTSPVLKLFLSRADELTVHAAT
jgi:LysR family hca operon transcriptional activator